jgi:hypothetical protein
MNRLDTFPKTDLIKNYRNVFGGPDGPKVLNHMLFEMGFFQDIENMTPEDAALKNYGSRLLRILGGGEVKETAMVIFSKHLMSQPLEKEKKAD